MTHLDPAPPWTGRVRRAFVTGGTGTLGTNVVEQFAVRGVHVTAVADQPPTEAAARHLQTLSGSVQFVVGDVLDRAGLRELMVEQSPDVVVHAAALTPDVATEAERGDEVVRVNCVGTLTTVRAAAEADVRRVVNVGSVAAYGGASAAEESRLDEEVTRDRPVNLYEVSKHAAELGALRLGQLLGVEVVSARVGDVFGRWERVTQTRTVLSGPVQVAARLLGGQPVTLPEAGERYWLYSPDAAHAIVCLAVAQHLRHRVYNVGGDDRWSLLDWARLCGAVADVLEISVDPTRSDVVLAADNPPLLMDRLRQDTSYRQQHDLHSAFADYVSWLRDNGSPTDAPVADAARRPV